MSKEDNERHSLILLFDSPGWKVIEEKLAELIDCENAHIESMISRSLSEKDREELNFHIARKEGMNRIFLLKEEIRESLEDPASNQGKS